MFLITEEILESQTAKFVFSGWSGGRSGEGDLYGFSSFSSSALNVKLILRVFTFHFPLVLLFGLTAFSLLLFSV